jgi:hypothetical protein
MRCRDHERGLVATRIDDCDHAPTGHTMRFHEVLSKAPSRVSTAPEL